MRRRTASFAPSPAVNINHAIMADCRRTAAFTFQAQSRFPGEFGRAQWQPADGEKIDVLARAFAAAGCENRRRVDWILKGGTARRAMSAFASGVLTALEAPVNYPLPA